MTCVDIILENLLRRGLQLLDLYQTPCQMRQKKVMCKRDDILCSVKKYIDENLNPTKQNISQGKKIFIGANYI